MPDMHLFNLPTFLLDEPGPFVRFEDQRFIEVIHVFDDDADTNTELVGMVGKAQYDETFDEDDRELLTLGCAQMLEAHMAFVLMNPYSYCYGSVKTSKGWRFVYCAIQNAAPKVRQ